MLGEAVDENKVAVSVIVAVYNAEAYLEQCLNSICKQTLQNIEIICVDDGSTDNSFSILEKYKQKDNRILIIQQEQQGAGNARNHGLQYAHGVYLSFLDADDFFEIDFLESLYGRARQTEADIVVCEASEYDQKTGSIHKMAFSLRTENLPQKQIFSHQDMPNEIFNSFQTWAWNKLFRTTFIKDNGLKFQEIQRTNDLLFTCLALVLAEKITILERSFIYYRVNHGGNCQSSNERAPFDFYVALLELKKQLQNQQLYGVVRSSYCNLALKSCIYNVLSIKDVVLCRSVIDFLTREGFAKLGINQMQLQECNRTIDKLELFFVRNGYWKLLKQEQTLKIRMKKILKK